MPAKKTQPHSSLLDRRQFLKMISLSGLSAFLAGCRSITSALETPTPLKNFSVVPSVVPPTSVPTAAPAYMAVVAIGQAKDYGPAGLYAELQRMLTGIGGLQDLVKPGAHVGLKPNLTGSPGFDPILPVPAAELFITHPALMSELVKLFYEAGAGKVSILESVGDASVYSAWGYTDMARSSGAELIDLNRPRPYSDFADFPVGPAFNIYESFRLNPVLKDLDVFVSVAKMKCHATAGVTLSMKNLFGIAPADLYKRKPEDDHRSSFHSTESFDRRVPRIILDLNIARPVHLSILDGILTSEGGEGPWIESLRPVRPGLLVAGRDPVATDSVAAALMGFDPAGESGKLPYTHGENHIALAAAAGLGTNRLDEIGISGPSIASVRFPFKPVP